MVVELAAPSSFHSYPSIFNFGHKALAELLADPVLVEEKVDGSQFSFGLVPNGEPGMYDIKMRSKGAVINHLAPEGMFIRAVETVNDLVDRGLLKSGWTYRGEYLAKPKHNSLTYDRAPRRNIILFDINDGHESYLSYNDVCIEAERLGLEVVPRIFEGIIDAKDPEEFRVLMRGFIDRESVLGGQKVEGVVVKNYAKFGPDKKVLMGKFVSEHFKEVHAHEWKAENPTQGDIIQLLSEKYKTPARWAKAVQHVREAGQLQDDPRDIGLLIKEVPLDIEKEEKDAIMAALYEWAWPKVRRGVTAGLAEWYKEELMKKQFA